MKFRLPVESVGVLCGLGVLLVSASAWGQGAYPARRAAPGAAEPGRGGGAVAAREVSLPADAVKIGQLTGTGRQTLVKTPEYKTSTPTSSTRPREWVQITVKYDTGPEWVSVLSVAYTVLALNETRDDKVYSLYRQTVEYLDVERGRDKLSTVYLSPPAVKRYGMPVAVHVEITADGQLIAQADDIEPGRKLPPKWWEASEVLNSVTARDGYLLKINATPFAFVNVDDYEVMR
ncbi:MAG: hypothetical protein O3B24_07345 [Verrucomicrobia bacterium]|nr:hypothetical protein [Verrucomicrobiota bacterium]